MLYHYDLKIMNDLLTRISASANVCKIVKMFTPVIFKKLCDFRFKEDSKLVIKICIGLSKFWKYNCVVSKVVGSMTCYFDRTDICYVIHFVT